MLTRRDLLNAAAALTATFTLSFKARANELKQGEEKLVMVRVPRNPQDLSGYLAKYTWGHLQHMGLEEGCDVTIQFHDALGECFGLKEELRSLKFRLYPEERNLNLTFDLAIHEMERLLSKELPEVVASDRFFDELRTVTIKVRPRRMLSNLYRYGDVYRIFELRKRK
jgi:hypothetical protein